MTVKASSPSALEMLEDIFNTINHILIGFVTIFVLYIYITIPYEIYNLHSIFGVLGYQFFMAEAILVFYARNSWSRQLSRKAKGWVHGSLQFLASSCALTGVGIELYVQDWTLLWYNNHVFLGLMATLLLIFNVLLGIVTFNAGQPAIRKVVKSVYLKFLHNIIGIACFVIGMTALYHAYGRNFMYIDFMSDDARSGLRAATLSSAILTALGAFRTLYSQFMSIVKLQQSRSDK